MYTKRYPVGEFGNWLEDSIDKLPMHFYLFAEDINLSPQVIRRHIREEIRPSVRITQLYSDYFREDFDYVYGLVLHDFLGIDSSNFSMWLWNNMTEHGYTVRSLSIATGISETSIYTHISAKYRYYPSFKMVKRYCQAFGIDEPFTAYELLIGDRYRRSQK